MDYTKTEISDHVEKVKDLFASGILAIIDGKITPNITPLWTAPWLFCDDGTSTKMCNFYKDITWPRYGLIHSDCHECWKVVVRPKTLKELFTVKDIQWELGYKGKCGIDTRIYTFGPYGAYWYNESLGEGLDKLDIVRKALDGTGMTAALKRGCTEYEGGQLSSEWTMTEEQKQIEKELDEIYNFKPSLFPMTEYVKLQVMRRWVEKAHEIGDATCFDYSSGPLGITSQAYEREK